MGIGHAEIEFFGAVDEVDRTGAWADRLNSMPKYVVTSTLDDLHSVVDALLWP